MYKIVTDSHHRAFLRHQTEPGFIAQVVWNDANLGPNWLRFERPGDLCAVQLSPMNRGVDMSRDDLFAAYEASQEAS